MTTISVLRIVTLLLLTTKSPAFTIPIHRSTSVSSTRLFNRPSHASVPEYLFQEDRVVDNEEDNTVADEPQVMSQPISEAETSRSIVKEKPHQNQKEKTASASIFYSALSPGTVVQIQVGDVGKARKAWKKRRRSGSPLLVPCSVLSVDRQAFVRWNCMYLLEKFGSPTSYGGIELELTQLIERHKTHLKTGLHKHATALGHEHIYDLIKDLFSKQAQDTYGIKLVERDDTIILQAASSKMRAQKRASSAAIVQFQDGDDNSLGHTGMVRVRNSQQKSSNFYSVHPLSVALRINPAKGNEFSLEGAIENGSIHAAVVFDYDTEGDAGKPMLTLALNPARVRERLKLGSPAKEALILEQSKYTLDELKVGMKLQGKVERFFRGGASIDCGVGRLRKDKSLVQCLGRLNFRDAVVSTGYSSQLEDEMDGMDYDDDDDDEELYDEEDEDVDNFLDQLDFNSDDFDDVETEEEDITHLFQQNDDGSLAFRNEETGTIETIVMDEEGDTDDDDDDHDHEDDHEDDGDADSEDITHLFEHKDDGSLWYTDPETGESHCVYSDGDDRDLTDMFEEKDDGSLTLIQLDQSRTTIGDQHADDSETDASLDDSAYVRRERRSSSKVTGPKRSQRLTVGDQITVYIKSVSRSGQLTLTMDSSVQGKRSRELKRDTEVSKRLARLSKRVGGWSRIQQLLGMECDGIVKATSNTGDWCYVEPNVEKIPVGVATVSQSMIEEDFRQGDGVRIRIEGVDENRGQLSMRILRRS